MPHNKQGNFSEICKSFRLMWDGFPYPVLLVEKNRNIVDVNESARNLGVPVGVRCRDISPYPDKCKNFCQANEALESGKTRRMVSRENGKTFSTYWIPLHSAQSGLYLHFVVDTTDE